MTLVMGLHASPAKRLQTTHMCLVLPKQCLVASIMAMFDHVSTWLVAGKARQMHDCDITAGIHGTNKHRANTTSTCTGKAR